jgi:MFS family permease
LFGVLYFIQGISEPSEGLISQPTRSLLRSWGYDAAGVSAFMAMLVLPWSIKPLYGLVTDFVPLFGTRRRSWLLVTLAATVVSLSAIYFYTPPQNMAWLLLVLLFVPTIAVAFSDVVVDALMVEEGQPRGMTGRLQGVQWAAIYGATILTGFLGGYLSGHHLQRLGFLIAGLATGVSLVMAWAVVREPRRTAIAADEGDETLGPGVRHAARDLWRGVSHPGILAIGAFMFLWNFNPFSTSVLYMHMVEHMKFSEQFYGNTVSTQALACMLASAAYAGYSRRLGVMRLVVLSIVAGLLATVGYWALRGETSALVIAFVMGFFYMTGMMVQLDLAARVCDVATAGTTFALLMSLSNLAVGLSAALGGRLYEWLAEGRDYTFAFNWVVGIGAAFTCGCFLLAPVIRKYCVVK